MVHQNGCGWSWLEGVPAGRRGALFRCRRCSSGSPVCASPGSGSDRVGTNRLDKPCGGSRRVRRPERTVAAQTARLRPGVTVFASIHASKAVREYRMAPPLSLTYGGPSPRDRWLASVFGDMRGMAPASVAKLESYKRQEISVGDLLALAIALGVPPQMLFCDPRYVDEVPIAAEVNLPVWDVMRWFLGQQYPSVDGIKRDHTLGFVAAEMLSYAVAVEDIEVALEGRPSSVAEVVNSGQGTLSEAKDTADYLDRVQLVELAGRIQKISDLGVPVPPISQFVLDRAQALGIELPEPGE